MHRAWDRTLVELSQPLPCVSCIPMHTYSLGWSGWLGQWNGLVLDNSLGASAATLLERKDCSVLVCSCFSIYWMLLSCHHGVSSMVVGGHRTISDSYCPFRSYRRCPLGCLCSRFHAHANLPLIPSFPSLWMSFWFLISLCSLTHCFGYPSLVTQPSSSSTCCNASFLALSHHQIYLFRGHGCHWSQQCSHAWFPLPYSIIAFSTSWCAELFSWFLSSCVQCLAERQFVFHTTLKSGF